MDPALWSRLENARTDEDRSWIVTESLLSTLPNNLASLVWAAAIPHWFNEEVLKAILPELDNQIGDLYLQLNNLPFVESFRGYWQGPEEYLEANSESCLHSRENFNIHELTRRKMLENLGERDREEFYRLSKNAASYFEEKAQQNQFDKIEWIYHSVLTGIDDTHEGLFSIGENYQEDFYTFLDGNSYDLPDLGLNLFAKNLTEQISTNLVRQDIQAAIYHWLGWNNYPNCTLEERLSHLKRAVDLYKQNNHIQGIAKSLENIGDILEKLDRLDEAIEAYDQSIQRSRQVNDTECESRALKGKGDVLKKKECYDEALEYYEQAREKVSSRSGKAEILFGIGEIWRIMTLNDLAKAFYREALELIEPDDILGQANAYQRFGQMESDPYEALKYLSQANTFYEQEHDTCNQSENLIDYIAPIYRRLGQLTEEKKMLINGINLARGVEDEITRKYLIGKAERRLQELEN
ncbi:MAG: tetratricopeptide repeat protein [Alkalinema sp. RU_4_3]|nr:tetratricopeptide repeat protein [Alkalinema sp. RU_4_3]